MHIGSTDTELEYVKKLSGGKGAQKLAEAEKAGQKLQCADAEKLAAFQKEVWEELDAMPWSGRADISIQITDKAFEKMMKEPEFKEKIMKVMREESMAASSGVSLTWIDEQGYRGYSYMEGYGKEAFAAHSKDKDSFYTQKADKKQDYKELWAKQRQQRKLLQDKLEDEYQNTVDRKRAMLKREQITETARLAYDRSTLSEASAMRP